MKGYTLKINQYAYKEAEYRQSEALAKNDSSKSANVFFDLMWKAENKKLTKNQKQQLRKLSRELQNSYWIRTRAQS